MYAIRRIVATGVLGLAAFAASAAWADSLFSKRVADNGTLISDQRTRYEVGDIETVLVRENIDATTEASTETEKEASLSATATTDDNRFLVGGGQGGLGLIPKELLPNWGIEMSNEHEAEGTTTRSNRLVMDVSCVVMKVLANGNIEIEGTKQVTVNREETQLTVKGTVRARDVSPANTVLSNQLANATIELKGHGPLWNNQRRGLFTKILDWVSPF